MATTRQLAATLTAADLLRRIEALEREVEQLKQERPARPTRTKR